MTPPKIENPLFFKLLEEKQIIHSGFVNDLLEELEGNALDVLSTLIQSGVATKRKLCQLWCDSIGIAHVDLEKSLFQPHVIRKFPERLARQLYAIPVYQMGNIVTVATPTPNNKQIKKAIEHIVNYPVNLVFALPQDIEWAIETHYQTNTALFEFFSKISTSKVFDVEDPITEKKLQKIAGKEAGNQFHVSLILYGITENASEIQIKPGNDFAAIYFIINETLHEQLKIDLFVYHKLLAKLKQMAKIDTGPKKEAQYSRILFPTPRKKIDIQFLCLPTEAGEKIFLKLMDRVVLPKIPALTGQYISARNIKQLINSITSLKGLFLVSGPPESGKSTLAYSMLKELQARGIKKIITVENAVKRLLKDIEQYQVNPKAGFDRKTVLNTCLKKHPNAIYIQNINDPEIAGIIRHTVKSGQFIIAGIESKDAFDAMDQIMKLDMGSVLSGILNQQFVRRLCDHCKKKYLLSPEEITNIFIWDGKTEVSAFREIGCPYCRHSGFFGQIGIQELIIIDDELQKLAGNDVAMADIKIKTRQLGFQNKEYDGIKKILRGLTTLNEIKKMLST